MPDLDEPPKAFSRLIQAQIDHYIETVIRPHLRIMLKKLNVMWPGVSIKNKHGEMGHYYTVFPRESEYPGFNNDPLRQEIEELCGEVNRYLHTEIGEIK
jgi:hypothetical protein